MQTYYFQCQIVYSNSVKPACSCYLTPTARLADCRSSGNSDFLRWGDKYYQADGSRVDAYTHTHGPCAHLQPGGKVAEFDREPEYVATRMALCE